MALNLNKKSGDTFTAEEVNKIGAAIDQNSSDIIKLKENNGSSRFIDLSKSQNFQGFENFIVKAQIKNPAKNTRYFISALLNGSGEKDVYIDSYNISTPEKSEHLPFFHNCDSGKTCYLKFKDNSEMSLVVDWGKLGNVAISWGTIRLEFSDYAYGNEEPLFGLDKNPTKGHMVSVPTSDSVYQHIAALYKIHTITKSLYQFILDFEQPYQASDGYACYITNIYFRCPGLFVNNIQDLKLDTVVSPAGQQSIQIPNGSRLYYDVFSKTFKLGSTTQEVLGALTLFTNSLGWGHKSDLDAQDFKVIQILRKHNITEEKLALWDDYALQHDAINNTMATVSRFYPVEEKVNATIKKNINFFNKNDENVIIGKFITANGVIQELGSLSTSGFIPVEAGKTYCWQSSSHYGPNLAHKLPFYTAIGSEPKEIVGEIYEKKTYLCRIKILETGFIRFGFATNNIDRQMFAEAESYPEEYVPYGIFIPEVEALEERTQKLEKEGIQGILLKSKNLFNVAEIQLNKRFDYNSTPYDNEGSCISGKIEATPNSVYTLHRSLTGVERTICCYSNANKPLGVLNHLTNEPIIPTKTQLGENFTFKAPKGTSYILFNIDWYPTYERGHGEDWQLEEGPEYTGFEKWFEPHIIVPFEKLPMELENLPARVGELEATNGSSVKRINVHSSDKIGFFSNSFLNGYTMYGKHAIEKMLMFSDYLPYNYSCSGDDMAEETARLDKDTPFLGICKPSEVGPIKYGIIMHQDNDGTLFGANHRSYYENAKHLGYSIMSLGGQPIISTEHDWANQYLIFQRLCQDEGWKFMNWGKVYNDISVGQYKPMWHSGHPATRSNWCQVNGYLPTILSLPKPVQSLKLFRLRSFIDSSNLKNLLYNTNTERAERFMELHNGQAGIKKGQEARFDRWGSGGYAGGNYDTVSYNCEYQDLIKNKEISFGKFLLADVTTPYNVRSVSYLKLCIKGSGIEKIYARQIRGMENSWLPSASSKFISFGITGGKENLHVGDTITISGIDREDGVSLNKQFTISGLTDEYIITTEPSGNHVTSGTDHPQCSVSSVTLQGSYDFPSGSYMENYDKPIGQWTQLEFTPSSEIVIQFTPEQIEKFGAADKFVFLASGTDIKITDIYVDVSGTNDKERHENSTIIPQPYDGTSLLSKTLFGASDIEWENANTLPIVTAVTDGVNTERLPEKTCRELSKNDWVAQKILTEKIPNKKYKKPVRVQVQILARWFPKYILHDEDYSATELNLDSFDMAKLEVQLNPSAHPSDISQFPVTTMYIGAWWHLYTFELDWVGGSGNYLTLICKDKRVQIASCDLVIVQQ